KWLIKFPLTNSACATEVLASDLYRALRVDVPVLRLVEIDDAALAPLKPAAVPGAAPALAVASLWIDNAQALEPWTQANPGVPYSQIPGLLNNFVIDCWLANWDVVGLTLNNVVIGPNGNAIRIDVGGCLAYK